ncbi:enoyl-CoA hydratase/isomerase family protein [Candidatus Thorarchaeota archaeon]|nr:MAG: enoyl-CoA hydratase/isomerase family protein [Candidatus Thorarchaeota archaeon]
MNGDILVQKEDSHAVITIAREEKLNSVTKSMLYKFRDSVLHIANEPSIRAIIFTGAGGRAFSAGFDRKMIQDVEGEEAVEFFKTLEKTIRLIRENRTCVTIAAVNGYAIGFGAMVALACDFRIFAETAEFRLPEIDLSIFPGAGAASNLLHLVGPSRAKDILMTGRKVSAREALQIGLTDMLVTKEELMDKTLEFVSGLLEKDPTILIRTKTLVDGMTGKDIGEADELESMYLDEWLRESD